MECEVDLDYITGPICLNDIPENAKLNPVAQNFVNEAIVRDCEKHVQYQSPNKLVISPKLSMEEKAELDKYYFNLNPQYLNCDNNSHAFAAAARTFETVTCYNKVGFSPNMDNPGDGFFVNDIGGDFVRIIKKDYQNVHVCSPVLGLRDAARRTNKLTQLNQFVNSRKDKKSGSPVLSANQLGMIDEVRAANSACYTNSGRNDVRICNSVVQSCNVKCSYGVAVHSLYDIKPIDLVDAMDNKGMITVSAVMHFIPEMFFVTKGRINFVNLVWEINHKNKTIEFCFLNDSSAKYVHDLHTYFSWFMWPTITSTRGNRFVIEYCENICGSIYLKIIRAGNLSQNAIEDGMKIRLWTHIRDYVVCQWPISYIADMIKVEPEHADIDQLNVSVSFFQSLLIQPEGGTTNVRRTDCDTNDQATRGANYDKFGDKYHYVTVLLPKDIYRKAYNFALNASATKFVVGQVSNYLRAISTMVFVGKDVVFRGTEIDPKLMYIAAECIYADAWNFKYRQGNHLKNIMNEAEYNRKLAESSLLRKLFTFKLSNSVVTKPFRRIYRRLDRFVYKMKQASDIMDCDLIKHPPAFLDLDQYFNNRQQRGEKHTDFDFGKLPCFGVLGKDFSEFFSLTLRNTQPRELTLTTDFEIRQELIVTDLNFIDLGLLKSLIDMHDKGRVKKFLKYLQKDHESSWLVEFVWHENCLKFLRLLCQYDMFSVCDLSVKSGLVMLEVRMKAVNKVKFHLINSFCYVGNSIDYDNVYNSIYNQYIKFISSVPLSTFVRSTKSSRGSDLNVPMYVDEIRELKCHPTVSSVEEIPGVSKAARKLIEIDNVYNGRFLKLLPSTTVVDLCAGPGSWSTEIIKRGNFLNTLDSNKIISASSKFNGKMNNNVTHPGYLKFEDICNDFDLTNSKHVVDLTAFIRNQRTSAGVELIVADGGISGDHPDQETKCMTLIENELAVILSTLALGGRCLVKLYVGESVDMVTVIGRFCSYFDSAELIKPLSSNRANGEIYLVANGFLGAGVFGGMSSDYEHSYYGLQNIINQFNYNRLNYLKNNRLYVRPAVEEGPPPYSSLYPDAYQPSAPHISDLDLVPYSFKHESFDTPLFKLQLFNKLKELKPDMTYDDTVDELELVESRIANGEEVDVLEFSNYPGGYVTDELRDHALRHINHTYRLLDLPWGEYSHNSSLLLSYIQDLECSGGVKNILRNLVSNVVYYKGSMDIYEGVADVMLHCYYKYGLNQSLNVFIDSNYWDYVNKRESIDKFFTAMYYYNKKIFFSLISSPYLESVFKTIRCLLVDQITNVTVLDRVLDTIFITEKLDSVFFLLVVAIEHIYSKYDTVNINLNMWMISYVEWEELIQRAISLREKFNTIISGVSEEIVLLEHRNRYMQMTDLITEFNNDDSTITDNLTVRIPRTGPPSLGQLKDELIDRYGSEFVSLLSSSENEPYEEMDFITVSFYNSKVFDYVPLREITYLDTCKLLRRSSEYPTYRKLSGVRVDVGVFVTDTLEKKIINYPWGLLHTFNLCTTAHYEDDQLVMDTECKKDSHWERWYCMKCIVPTIYPHYSEMCDFIDEYSLLFKSNPDYDSKSFSINYRPATTHEPDSVTEPIVHSPPQSIISEEADYDDDDDVGSECYEDASDSMTVISENDGFSGVVRVSLLSGENKEYKVYDSIPNLYEVDTPGDGDCLYHALSRNLMDPKQLKQIIQKFLPHSNSYNAMSDLRREGVVECLSSPVWGSTDIIDIYAEMYCITVYEFSGDITIKHGDYTENDPFYIRHNINHFSLLLPVNPHLNLNEYKIFPPRNIYKYHQYYSSLNANLTVSYNPFIINLYSDVDIYVVHVKLLALFTGLSISRIKHIPGTGSLIAVELNGNYKFTDEAVVERAINLHLSSCTECMDESSPVGGWYFSLDCPIVMFACGKKKNSIESNSLRDCDVILEFFDDQTPFDGPLLKCSRVSENHLKIAFPYHDTPPDAIVSFLTNTLEANISEISVKHSVGYMGEFRMNLSSLYDTIFKYFDALYYLKTITKTDTDYNEYNPSYIVGTDLGSVAINSAIEIRETWKYSGSKILGSCRNVYTRLLSMGKLVGDSRNSVFTNSEVASGAYNLLDRSWFKRPDQITKYNYVFGQGTKGSYIYPSKDLFKHGLDFDYEHSTIKNMINDGVVWLIVTKALEVHLEPKLYETVKDTKITPGMFDNVNIRITEGVPGAGKTYHILQQHKFTGDGSEIILTATRNAAEDIRSKILKKYPEAANIDIYPFYTTLESCMLNLNKYGNVNTIYFDEAFLKHIGQCLWIANLLKVKEIVLVGDAAQIPYSDRNGLACKFSSANNLKNKLEDDNYTFLSTSHRIPQDVAHALNTYIRKREGTSLLKMYPKDVNTSNSVERSMQFRIISSSKEIPLNHDHYIVYTQSEKSILKKECGIDNVTTVHEFQGQERRNIALVRLNTTNTLIYDEPSQILTALSRHREQFVYYTKVVDTTSEIIRKTAENIIPSSVYIPRTGGGAPFNLARNEGYISKLINDRLKVFEMRPDTKFMLVPDYVVDLKGENSVLVDIATMNSDCGAYRAPRPVCVPDPTFEFMTRLPVIECNKYDVDPNLLQVWVNTIKPTACMTDRRLWNEVFEDSDLHINSYNFSISPPRAPPVFKDTMTPFLRTSCPSKVTTTTKSVLKSFNERNGLVSPMKTAIFDEQTTLEDWDLFKKCYFKDNCDDLLKIYREHPVEPNLDTITKWLESQPGAVYEEIKREADIPTVIDYVIRNNYNYILKNAAKPKLENRIELDNSSSQAIAYLTKMINVIYCPIVQELKHRLYSLLLDDKVVFSDMSVSTFEEILSHKFPVEKLANVKYKIEIDFAKFDRSQQEDHLNFECKVLLELGMPMWLVILWKFIHIFTKLVNLAVGFKAFVFYQRKSGDALTFIGNTLILMLMLARLFGFIALRYAFMLLAGDDSLLFILANLFLDLASIFIRAASIYNMEMKLIKSQVYYFCSRFLLPITEDNCWYVVPDILKALVKLGRSDILNEEHAREYQISLSDNWKNLQNVRLYDEIDKCMTDRYAVGHSCDQLYEYMWNIVNDDKFVEKMYYWHDYDTKGYYNILPVLE